MELWGSRLPFRVSGCLSSAALQRAVGTGRCLQYEQITHSYENLSRHLSTELSSTKTSFEQKFVELCRIYTGLKPKTSYWIGPYCIDVFFPQFGSRLRGRNNSGVKWRGIAFEIDGHIHNRELKMKKDTQKAKALRELGICVHSVDNERVDAKYIHDTFFKLGMVRDLDSRGMKRLLGRLQMLTIFAWSPYGLIDGSFGVPEGSTQMMLSTKSFKSVTKDQMHSNYAMSENTESVGGPRLDVKDFEEEGDLWQ
jgi:very-short-patch-repair endonuclease